VAIPWEVANKQREESKWKGLLRNLRYEGFIKEVTFGYPHALSMAEVTSMKSTIALLALSVLGFSTTYSQADELSVLKTAGDFAVLGATTVTNTGPSVLGADLGVSPGTAITGFPPGGFSNGGMQVGQIASAQGEIDAFAGYSILKAIPFTQNLTGQDLGGKTLTPGVYFFASSAELTGPLILNFEGLSNVSFIFQTGSTLTTASGSSVDAINQGTNDNIYWAIGSSATFGTTSAFEGDVIADQSITLTTGASIGCGNAIALTGAVTLDTNQIDTGCSAGGTTPPPVSAVPEPGSLTLFATGLIGAAGFVRRRFSV
jgi:hypothetical protein